MSVPESKLSMLYNGHAYEVDKSLWIVPPVMMPYRGLVTSFGVSSMRNNFIYHVMEDTMSKLIQGGIPQVK